MCCCSKVASNSSAVNVFGMRFSWWMAPSCSCWVPACCREVITCWGLHRLCFKHQGKSRCRSRLTNMKAYTPLPPPHIYAEVLGTGSCLYMYSKSVHIPVFEAVWDQNITKYLLHNISPRIVYVYWNNTNVSAPSQACVRVLLCEQVCGIRTSPIMCTETTSSMWLRPRRSRQIQQSRSSLTLKYRLTICLACTGKI